MTGGGSNVVKVNDAGANPAGAINATKHNGPPAGRPKLIYTASDWSALDSNISSNSVLTSTKNRLGGLRSSLLNAPLPTSATWDLGEARDLEDRVLALSALCHLDNDRPACEKVVDIIKHLTTSSATADWTPLGSSGNNDSSWLGQGHISYTVGHGYDQAYSYMSEAERSSVESGARTRGIDQWLNHGVHDYNRGGVISGGFGVLLLSFDGETTYQSVIDQGFNKLSSDLTHGALWNDANPTPPGKHTIVWPGGAYAESEGYAAYYSDHLNPFFLAYRNVNGVNHPLFGQWQGRFMPAFLRDLVGPNLYAGRYGDGSQEFYRRTIMNTTGIIAKLTNNDHYAWIHADSERYEPTSSLDGGKAAAWMMFYDGPGTDPVDAGVPTTSFYEGLDMFISRENWTSSNAVRVLVKGSGNQNEGHSHLDSGDVQIEGEGLKFFTELGEDNRTGTYDDYGSFGNRWKHPRVRAALHNTLTINPTAEPDQRADEAFSPVANQDEVVTSGNSPFIIEDLTPEYSGRAPWGTVNSVKRGVKVIGGDTVLIQDEISGSAALSVKQHWHSRDLAGGTSPFTITHGGMTATIKASGDNRRMVCRLLDDGTFSQGEVDAMSNLPAKPAGVKSNTDFRKLQVSLSGSSSYTIAMVCYPLAAADSTPSKAGDPAVVPLSAWSR
jgi:hypothetical protein